MARANTTRELGNYLDLAFLSAFDLTLLLEHVLGWLLSRTFSGADVVPHATLGHGTICSFYHLRFHGLLAFLHSCLGHGDGDCLLATTRQWGFLWAFGITSRMECSRLIFTHHFCYFRLLGGFGLWCLHGSIISCFYHLCNATSCVTMRLASWGHSSSHP